MKYEYDRRLLQDMMIDRGLRSADMGRLLGVSKQAFSQIWHGERGFSVPQIRKIAAAWELSPQQVVDLFIFPKNTDEAQ